MSYQKAVPVWQFPGVIGAACLCSARNPTTQYPTEKTRSEPENKGLQDCWRSLHLRHHGRRAKGLQKSNR